MAVQPRFRVCAMHHSSAMSDPILAPEMPAAEGSGPPLSLLTRRYPSGGGPTPLTLLFVLGAWLLVAPAVLGYPGHAHGISDQLSGGAILLIAFASAVTLRPWISWLAGAIGFWLILAPVVLHAPTIPAYVIGTLAGMLVVFEGLVVPLSWRTPGDEIPAGWSYNPSAWRQRVPVVLLAAASILLAGYLAMFQLGLIDRVWDPVFGDGTRRVLTSEVSRAWPVSDAGLGAAMFAADLLMTLAGDRRRWRTMPWLVMLFGVMIVPIGVVSIGLVMLQPVAVGAWCFWCLLTAAATLAMIPLAIDEVTASVQVLRQAVRRGESWWRVLWRGDTRGAAPVAVAPVAPARPPWTLAVIALAGLWLMIEPAVIATPAVQADSARITGALLIVVAAIATSELARPLRFVAVPLALWVVASPWLLAGAPPVTRLTGLVVAVVVVLATWPRGVIGHRHGTADRFAVWPS